MSFDKKRSIRLLKLFCPSELQESIIGDLEEQYEINLASRSRFYSNLLLTYNSLRFLRIGILRRKKYTSKITALHLLYTFLKVFGRSAKRNLAFYSINLTGVTIGISVIAFTLLYLKNETSYDSFHPNAENIYRVAGKRTYGPWFPHVRVEHSDAIVNNEFAWTQKASRISRVPEKYVHVGEKKFAESDVLVIESGDRFFEVFGLKLIHGDPATATKNTNSIILNETSALKYFGYENPVGKSIRFDSLRLNVSAVVQDLPTNTHLSFDMLLVSDEYFSTKSSALVYFHLTGNSLDHIKEEILKNSELVSKPRNVLTDVALQNIQDIHLNSNLTFELKPGGDKNQLIVYGSIAIVILLISCTNFTNLSTAIFSKRRKEMAVRKVLGSKRYSLTIQFLFESILLSLLSLPLVYIAMGYLLPYFNEFTGIEFQLYHLIDFELVSLLIAITILTGFLSGIYPSLIMPRIKVLRLFKNDFGIGQHIPVRKALVTLQFIMLIGLGAGAFIINQQLAHMSTLDTGINKEGVLKLKRAWSLDGVDRIKAFKKSLLSQSYILSVSHGYVPGDEDYPTKYQPEGLDVTLDDAISLGTDFDYLNVLGIEGKYGPFFSEENHPKVSLLVNEVFAKNLGWDDPVGKRVNTSPESVEPRWHTIRGVYSDFNFFSLHHDITPQMMFIRDDRQYINQNVLVKINMSHATQAFEWIEKVWDEYLPETPLNYAFLDDDIQEAYYKDQQTSKTSSLLAVLAVILCVLGLVGITAFLTSLRTKEIGIRKILGATPGNLLFQFTREYFPLILGATVISSATSYFFLDSWLENFAYRIEINPSIFLISGLLLTIITSLTVSAEGLKIIRENPANTLRHE